MTMKVRMRTQIVAAVAVTLIGFGAGCGDNSNNSNDNGTPQPTKTATPGAGRTSTPVAGVTPTVALTPTVVPTTAATTHTVTFTANSSAQIQGFDLRITYPTAKGGFDGSADSVACSSAAPGFTKNDKDDGNLTLISASSSNLTFPITITCTFSQTAGAALSASDIGTTVHEVTQNGATGDASLLTVDVSVS
jgi:hypothetical protein